MKALFPHVSAYRAYRQSARISLLHVTASSLNTPAHMYTSATLPPSAIDIIRQAKKRGVNVTSEVTVHHLTLTDEACADYNSATRVNPPLRSADHVQAMREAVLDGTVDAIVTDHSPHAPEEKDVEFRYAPNGFCGLETSLAVMLTDLYHTHVFDLNTYYQQNELRAC
mgnify:CR=1 FL=1